MAGFYPLYERAQRTFGVNWLLLASVHRQETAFSTAPWHLPRAELRRLLRRPDAVQRHQRPADVDLGALPRRLPPGAAARPSYPHPTARHPSVYDDFDAIMAAASCSPTRAPAAALDQAAWQAAYDYYGHDLTAWATPTRSWPGPSAGPSAASRSTSPSIRPCARRWRRPGAPPVRAALAPAGLTALGRPSVHLTGVALMHTPFRPASGRALPGRAKTAGRMAARPVQTTTEQSVDALLATELLGTTADRVSALDEPTGLHVCPACRLPFVVPGASARSSASTTSGSISRASTATGRRPRCTTTASSPRWTWRSIAPTPTCCGPSRSCGSPTRSRRSTASPQALEAGAILPEDF